MIFKESCRLHFKEQRDKLGVTCQKYGYKSHYWIQVRWSYEAKKYRTCMSLKSDTIMEYSKLSFLVWYKTMFLMTVTKKGFSTLGVQKQLGLKRYEPVWAIVHKLRKAVGNRDSKYTLEGMLEINEVCFKVETSEIDKSKTKSGRGSTGVRNVAIMAESTVLEDIETSKKQNHVRYFKVVVLEDHKAEGGKPNSEKEYSRK